MLINKFSHKHVGSPYTKAISAGILALQEKGILQKLKIKWWKEMHGGGMCVVSLAIFRAALASVAI